MDVIGESANRSINQSNTSTQTTNQQAAYYTGNTTNQGLWLKVDEFGPLETACNYFLFLVCLATIVSDSLALYVVRKGRNFPRFCRIISMNYLVSDLIGAACFAFHQILIYACGYNYDIVLNSRTTFFAIPLLTSAASVALISVERVFALSFHMSHRVVSGTAAFVVIIAALWSINIGPILITILVKIGTDCQWDLHQCYIFDVLSLSRYVSTAMLASYDSILIITNLIIQNFVRRHMIQIVKQRSAVQQQQGVSQQTNNNNNGRQLSADEQETWQIVAKIVMSFFVLHVPITTMLFVHEWYGHNRNDLSMRMSRIFSFMCLQTSSFVHLYLYVFKLKENKLNLYILLSHVFKRYTQRAEQLRMSVYNIPTVSSKARKSDSAASE